MTKEDLLQIIKAARPASKDTREDVWALAHDAYQENRKKFDDDYAQAIKDYKNDDPLSHCSLTDKEQIRRMRVWIDMILKLDDRDELARQDTHFKFAQEECYMERSYHHVIYKLKVEEPKFPEKWGYELVVELDLKNDEGIYYGIKSYGRKASLNDDLRKEIFQIVKNAKNKINDKTIVNGDSQRFSTHSYFPLWRSINILPQGPTKTENILNTILKDLREMGESLEKLLENPIQALATDIQGLKNDISGG